MGFVIAPRGGAHPRHQRVVAYTFVLLIAALSFVNITNLIQGYVALEQSEASLPSSSTQVRTVRGAGSSLSSTDATSTASSNLSGTKQNDDDKKGPPRLDALLESSDAQQIMDDSFPTSSSNNGNTSGIKKNDNGEHKEPSSLDAIEKSSDEYKIMDGDDNDDASPLDPQALPEDDRSALKVLSTQNNNHSNAARQDIESAISANSSSPLPLSDLIDEEKWQVKDPITNVQDQLDFVIIGHAKTGTTFLLRTWFPTHPDIRMPLDEWNQLSGRKGPAKVVHLMHSLRTQAAASAAENTNSSLSPGYVPHAIYGYKNPQEITLPTSLEHFQKYFPRTKLIVGLRHPVWWFQSFYNFRIRPGKGLVLPDPRDLIGACNETSHAVCTDNSNFHYNLAGLGLTNRNSSRELELLSTRRQTRPQLDAPGLPNPIFIYEQTQLDAGDAQVSEALRQDMTSFLGLHSPLAPIQKRYKAESKLAFSICEPQHKDLRRELVRIGKAASSWILEFFVDQPTVTVSSRNNFAMLLRKWGEDPCTTLSSEQHQHGNNSETALSVDES